MLKHGLYRHGLLLLYLSIALCFGSCEGSDRYLGRPAPVPAGREYPQLEEQTLPEALAAISSARPPARVDQQTFTLLKAELMRALAARGVSKFVASPPAGADNATLDLVLAEDGLGGHRLEWTYTNIGDYDRDGLVGISDLTPIGMYFGVDSAIDKWPSARVADGNGDEAITINDITPIGQHWQSFVAGYNIYSSAQENGPWSLVGSLPLPAPSGDGPLRCSFDLGADVAACYRVVPKDDAGAEGMPSNVSLQLGTTAVLSLGADDWLVTQTVGQQGGVVQGPTGSALEGVSVSFPLGALPTDTPVRLGVNSGMLVPAAGAWGGLLVSFDTGAVEQFAVPVEITVPYSSTKGTQVFVPYAVTDTGRLAAACVLGIDDKNNQATIATFAAHNYWTWVAANSSLPPAGTFVARFQPELDGFQVQNSSTRVNGGECLGYAAFALWYFQHHTTAQGHLYHRFMYSVGITNGQHTIVTRAHTSILGQWGTLVSRFLNYQFTLTNSEVFTYICNAIQNTGDPVMVYMDRVDHTAGAHAALVYGFDATGLRTYNGNCPGIRVDIPYNATNGVLGPSGCYDRHSYCGDGSLYLTEPYSQILEDAQRHFSANGNAVIEITSPASGGLVSGETFTLSGHVSSTDLLVSELWTEMSSQDVTGFERIVNPIPMDGNFSLVLPVHEGKTYYNFETYGVAYYPERKLYVANDMLGIDGAYKLEGTGEPATLSVELVWNVDKLNLDLYIIDPSGDYSSADKHDTADGGQLSIDDVPAEAEYWALRADSGDTVRWGQPYTVRVHFMDAKGISGGAGFAVRVIENEGQPDQSIQWYPGFLLQDGPTNKDPGASGPDWYDVCTIYP